MTARSQYMD